MYVSWKLILRPSSQRWNYVKSSNGWVFMAVQSSSQKNIRKYGSQKKLDRVGPVDNRPSTDKIHHFVQKRKKTKKNDMCHVTHRGWWTLYQNSRSPALTVWVWRCFEDLEEKDMWLNREVNKTSLHLPSLHHHFTITSPSLPFFVCLFTLCGRACPTIH